MKVRIGRGNKGRVDMKAKRGEMIWWQGKGRWYNEEVRMGNNELIKIMKIRNIMEGDNTGQ